MQHQSRSSSRLGQRERESRDSYGHLARLHLFGGGGGPVVVRLGGVGLLLPLLLFLLLLVLGQAAGAVQEEVGRVPITWDVEKKNLYRCELMNSRYTGLG